MNLSGKVVLESGFIFDYAAMLGTEVISTEKIVALQDEAKGAAAALAVIRDTGIAKAHLSKDGRLSMCFLPVCRSLGKGIPIPRNLFNV